MTIVDYFDPAANRSPKTVVGLVIDRSGSMASVQAETLQGMNSEIQAIKDNANGDTRVFLTHFDHEIDKILTDVKASELATIDRYEPRGSQLGCSMLLDRSSAPSNIA